MREGIPDSDATCKLEVFSSLPRSLTSIDFWMGTNLPRLVRLILTIGGGTAAARGGGGTGGGGGV